MWVDGFADEAKEKFRKVVEAYEALGLQKRSTL